MMLQNKKIAIIGGGPGGLTLARLLQMQGVDVKVYERDLDETARQQGATLDLHEESGLEALKRANLMNEFLVNYRPNAGKLRLLDEKANIHSDDHSEENTHSDSRPEIDRQPLRDILYQSLKPNTVVWDSQFVEMEKQNDGWLIHFKNNTKIYADLVIAVDGANSNIRSYITDIKPLYSGVTIVEGNIYNAEKNAPKLWELVKGGKIFALGNEQTIILSAKGEGSLSFYTGCKDDEYWTKTSGIDFNNKEQVSEWFKTAFATWNNVWQELFSTDEMWFIPRPQYHFPLDQHWNSLPNLTMLGDAAHRMPPYAGEGVNMAMQDAFELAECLTSNKYENVHSAITAFEKKMQKRASEITQDTLNNTELMHSENGLQKLLDLFNQMREQ
jgi:2-polyprenyl-6-methoxyphenol hydroxylase-like FAD-dependent oxidoreductase